MKKLVAGALFLLIFVPNVLAGEFWASKNYYTYHLPDCKWVQDIKPENLIKFQSREEAIKAGYIPCKFCLQSFAEVN